MLVHEMLHGIFSISVFLIGQGLGSGLGLRLKGRLRLRVSVRVMVRVRYPSLKTG